MHHNPPMHHDSSSFVIWASEIQVLDISVLLYRDFPAHVEVDFLRCIERNAFCQVAVQVAVLLQSGCVVGCRGLQFVVQGCVWFSLLSRDFPAHANTDFLKCIERNAFCQIAG